MGADASNTSFDETGGSRSRGLWPSRWRYRISLILLAIIAIALAAAWFSRERIAGNVIDDLFAESGVEASYDIVSIDPQRQVIANLVIGDSTSPDFTAERVTINLDYGLRAPTIEGVLLDSPRLYGTYIDGELSFGSLDPLIFTGGDEPPSLPDLNLSIADGRALIESDFGAIAAKIDGAGRLDDGFSAKLAVTAPGLGTEECKAQSATVYGDLTTRDGSPSFDGPIRLRNVACGAGHLARADLSAQVELESDFSGASGSVNLRAADMAYGASGAERISGTSVFSWGEGGLKLGHDLAVQGLSSPYSTARSAAIEGDLRSDPNFARGDWDADVTAQGLKLAEGTSAIIADARRATSETLFGPLLAKFERNFSRVAANGSLDADVTVRFNEQGTSILIPEGRLSSSNGEAVVALSRFAWSDGSGETRLTGNFVTGGKGLPRINGRMEQTRGGALALRATMAEYGAGENRLAIPRFQAAQDRAGRVTFSGIVAASGALPGGNVRGLVVPLDGTWSESRGLALGERCTEVRFASLAISQLNLRGQRIALCPQRGGAMVRYGNALDIGIETRAVALSGDLAGSPTILSADAASFGYPGGFTLENMNATIGAEGSAVRLAAAEVTGEVGGNFGGSFSGGNAGLDIVPLNLTEMDGRWAYVDQVLVVNDATFLLSERVDGVEVERERFEPLIARDATLTLQDSDITAAAELRHPGTGRLVTRVDVVHNLSNGVGSADLAVPGVTFDEQMRPQDLTYLTQGVIAFADGTITGSGEIDWADGEITSTGTFSTGDLDLAAAFGPIDGISGTIEFTDLLGLTTASGQTLRIGALNPGIEVLGGQIKYRLIDGETISLEEASWPFMEGRLILRPVDIKYGDPGPQRYVFEIVGLDAAAFVAQMELGNVSATGTFDGTVPILFDDEGNGFIDDGLLISRPPGGNVSYVGELTYEDLGAIGDFAFQALRSLDYNQMSVGLSGSLAGEIITSFNIDGVRQGEGASQNFLTRRIAKLPIKFRINIRSESFYELATIARVYLDPATARDPRELGLFRLENGVLVPTAPGEPPVEPPQEAPEDEAPVQPPAIQNRESEPMP